MGEISVSLFSGLKPAELRRGQPRRDFIEALLHTNFEHLHHAAHRPVALRNGLFPSGVAKLLRDPLAVEHASVEGIDALIAKLRMVVAGFDHHDAAWNVRESAYARSATAFSGIETMTLRLLWRRRERKPASR
jgi:hypothetical protein